MCVHGRWKRAPTSLEWEVNFKVILKANDSPGWGLRFIFRPTQPKKMVDFDRLNPGPICFDRLDPSCLYFEYVCPRKNISINFDRVKTFWTSLTEEKRFDWVRPRIFWTTSVSTVEKNFDCSTEGKVLTEKTLTEIGNQTGFVRQKKRVLRKYFMFEFMIRLFVRFYVSTLCSTLCFDRLDLSLTIEPSRLWIFGRTLRCARPVSVKT